jgi:hypothetical protein
MEDWNVMKTQTPHLAGAAALLAVCLFTIPTHDALSGGAACSRTKLAASATSNDPAIAKAAIAALRQEGQAGLDALFTVYAARIAKLRDSGEPATYLAEQRLREVLDEVAQQRDSHAAQLFWHTDFEAAKKQAQATGKPILSLRLLGKLNDELSCANSRFFRTTLYSNAEVSQLLRDRFILHWQSVRPVPKVRIDFGEGRTVETTVTGNSIHYILNPDGRVIDAMPGLYAPRVFQSNLEQSHAFASANTPEKLAGYHAKALRESLTAWTTDLRRAAVSDPAIRGDHPTRPELVQATSDAAWEKIARLHQGNIGFDHRTSLLHAAKFPPARVAAPIAVSKSRVELPIFAALNHMTSTVALDTVRNEYLLRAVIHEWFANNDPSTRELARLNDRIYSELFLTPANDPWLGLAPAQALVTGPTPGVRN